MILTIVQMLVRPEVADSFPFLMREFTERTRAHTGNLWCTWSRNIENPDEFTLNEAFEDAARAIKHATSDYFTDTMRVLPTYLQRAPWAINADLPGSGWVKLMDLPFFAQARPEEISRFS